ncbi:MAG: hypothetical protein ACXWDI_08320 [Nocardioides sp.]
MERPRCVHCRNPIKEHQAAVGPTEGDRSFHADCWSATHPDDTPPPVDRPVAPVEAADEPRIVEQSDQQRDYERRIASEGLAALLSPYVTGLPTQRNKVESVPA